MYGIALSVAACMRAGTRVDLAWILSHPQVQNSGPVKTIAVTPGGGRLGSLDSKAVENQLIELAGLQGHGGRIHRISDESPGTETHAVESQAPIDCVLVSGSGVPESLWVCLLNREPVCLVGRIVGDMIEEMELYTADTISELGGLAEQMFDTESSVSEIVGNDLITVLWPLQNLVIVAEEEAARPLYQMANLLGWAPVVTSDANEAVGLIATLSKIDGVVVMGHDIERAGRALAAALEGEVGYIGAVGSERLRNSRSDWLAYRGFTDLSRVASPAGLDIGARNPSEIAVAIVGQMITLQTASRD
ncbi:MAG: XdhC family protein [Acidimicrobiales bacterium]|nr:XdhC family protein [Acidimicrobiales bacterium]